MRGPNETYAIVDEAKDHGAFEEGKRKFAGATPVAEILFNEDTAKQVTEMLEKLGLKVKKRTFDGVLGMKLQVTSTNGMRMFLYKNEKLTFFADGSFGVRPAGEEF